MRSEYVAMDPIWREKSCDIRLFQNRLHQHPNVLYLSCFRSPVARVSDARIGGRLRAILSTWELRKSIYMKNN